MFYKQTCMVSVLVLLLSSATTSASAEDAPCSKGLFYEQMDHPAEKLNTGVKYWIELYRGNNKMKLVDNRTVFQSGDKIRLRLIPNINGYAYIASKGSSGRQAVLFPPSGSTNKVVAGKQYSLPSTGFLVFDDLAGTERLSLVMSRAPVDSKALLKLEGSQTMLSLASSNISDKPVLVGNGLVTYPEQESQPIRTAEQVDTPTETSKDIGGGDDFSKDLFYQGAAPAGARKPAHRSGAGSRKRVFKRHTGTTATKPKPPTPPGVIVLNVNPEEILGAGIMLEHK